jgi:hypothetical protein
MAKSQTTVAEAVNSVVAPVTQPEVIALHGRPASELDDTIIQLGFDTCKADSAMEQASRTMAQCQTALFDIVNGLNYVQFQYVRQQFIIGGVDSGKTAGAAEQVWDKQINQVCKAFGFTRPKSEAKDAQRKAEAKAKAEAEMALISDLELSEKITSLIESGTSKSLKEAAVLQKEVDKRNKPALDAADAQRKATGDKIIARVKELVKAKTDDADEILFRILASLS